MNDGSFALAVAILWIWFYGDPSFGDVIIAYLQSEACQP